MSAQTVYSGPGKVTHALGSGPTYYTFHAEGENGQVNLTVDERRTRRATATHGYIQSQLEDVSAKITLTPFDSWALLPVLFPKYLGVTVGATTGVLAIGTRPHDFAKDPTGAVKNGLAPTSIWTPDGRLYSLVRTAVTRHPGMRLGVGQPLFEGIELTALCDPAKSPGDSAALFGATPVTESGGTDPESAGFTPDFINGHWTAAWGAVTGFDAMEVEDYWKLTVDAKYSLLKIQGLSRHMKLDSVEVMVKGRLAQPTHTQLAAQILEHTLGGTLTEGSATDLVLSGPSSKTITLKDCEVFLEGSGFEFGGARLGTGEVAFVSKVDFAGSPKIPSPTLIFSA